MSRLVDAVERERICQDLTTHFLVEASAGSGKTFSLVSRVVSGIVSGAFSIDSVAVVTFTRKAAGELSGRLRLALESHPSPQARQALSRYEQIFVGTVHSFCAQILRRYPVQAALSPGFREIEDAEDLQLQRRALRAALAEREGRRLLKALTELNAGTGDLAQALQTLVAYGELDYPGGDSPRPDLGQAWHTVEEFSRYLDLALPVTEERDPTCKLLVAGRSLQRRAALAKRETPGDLVRLLEEWEADLKPVKKYWGQSRADQNQNLDAFLLRSEGFQTNFVRPQLAAWRAHLYSQCMPFLKGVRSACQHQRQQLALVNFHDLLSKCAALVRDHPQVRRQLQSRYRTLLVDEFQDTDPLQAELFFLLAGEELEEKDWTRVTPRPGSLFIVGDPKQSIYRFRRADIETYHSVRRRLLETGGAVLPLVTSFRSQPSLCHWINQVFQSLLPPEPTPEQAPFSPLVPRLREGANGAPVMTLTLACARYQDVAPEEAHRIADYIQAAVASGDYRYGDFLILTVRKAELLHHQHVLEQRQVPCLVSSDPTPLSESGRALTTLLQVLANPHDTITLVGVLRGPLFGHSDEELYLHCREAGGLHAPSAATEAASQGPVNSSLEKLDNWRQRIRRLPLGAAARLVARESGLLAQATLAGSVEELESLADALGASGEVGLTLPEALREIHETQAVPVISRQVGQRDVVRVMNLHKAKGLEARVVFLAAPTNGLPLHASHAIKGQGGALCMWRNRKRLAHPLNWEELETRELDFLAAERRRLLYVAATRAKETLVVGRWSGSHALALRPWSDLDDHLVDCPELPIPSLPVSPVASAEHLPADAFLSGLEQEQKLREACLQPSWRRAAVSASAGGAEQVSYLPPEGLQGQGTAWGDLIHRLLEQAVAHPELTSTELESLARWFVFDTPELTDLIPAALEVIDKIKQTDFWARISGARERLVEVPFGQRVGSTLLQGVIDLVLRQEDGWDIIDYKTDRQRLEALIARYATQVQQYASSWESITEESVNFVGIYAIRESKLSGDLQS